MKSKLARSGRLRTVFGMNALQTHAFTQLLASWRRREDARQNADVRELANARFELDVARAQMRTNLRNLG